MIDFILDHIWQVFIAIISVVAYIVRLESGLKRNNEKYEEMQKQIAKMEMQSAKSREEIKHEVAELATSVVSGFNKVDATLEKIIFRLGDKADRE